MLGYKFRKSIVQDYNVGTPEGVGIAAWSIIKTYPKSLSRNGWELENVRRAIQKKNLWCVSWRSNMISQEQGFRQMADIHHSWRGQSCDGRTSDDVRSQHRIHKVESELRLIRLAVVGTLYNIPGLIQVLPNVNLEPGSGMKVLMRLKRREWWSWRAIVQLIGGTAVAWNFFTIVPHTRFAWVGVGRHDSAHCLQMGTRYLRSRIDIHIQRQTLEGCSALVSASRRLIFGLGWAGPMGLPPGASMTMTGTSLFLTQFGVLDFQTLDFG